MSDERTQSPNTHASAPAAGDLHAQTILAFIEWVMPHIPEEDFIERYRITLRGLFVPLSDRAEVLHLYHQWCAETSRPTEISDEKCARKLFGAEPKRYFLPEGKVTLHGFFVACPIADPQCYRVPFHLGTPTEAADALLAQDPVFAELQDVELHSGRDGEGLHFKLHAGIVRFLVQSLALFQRLCGQSQKIAQKFPRFSEGMSEGLRALHKVLHAARPITPAQEPVQPLRFVSNRRGIECLSAWGFYFYVDKSGWVQLFSHEYGRNLTGFLRQEMGQLVQSRDRLDDILIELPRKPAPFAGVLTLHGRRLKIDWRALGAYIREVLEAPHLWADEKEPRTLRTALREFSRIISRADPIDRAKVSSYLGPNYRHGFRFAVNEMWLFVVSQEWEVVDCVARIARNRVEEHPPGRRR